MAVQGIEYNLHWTEDLVLLLQEISPTAHHNNSSLSHLHKSVYEFFLAQRVLQETLAAAAAV
jgi:hypothetical protein